MGQVKLGIIGGTGRLYAGPTLVGVGKGYFKDEGVDVDIVEVVGRTGLDMLGSNELDVTPLGAGLYFYNNLNPERPMKVVADQGQQRPGRGSGAIVARPSIVEGGELRDFADLRGKRVGLSPDRGDHDWLTFANALRRGGLTFDDVEIVTIDFGDARHKALEAGAIDVSTVGRLQSIIEGRKAGAFVPWKHEYEVEPGRQQFAVLFSHRFWSERPDDARRYVHAYLRGSRVYYDAFDEGFGKDAVVSVLAQQTGYSSDAIGRDMVPAGVDPNGHVNADSIRYDLEWLKEQKLVTKPVTVEQIVDHSYVDAALADLGPYRRPNERASAAVSAG